MYDTSTDYDSEDEVPVDSNTGQTQSSAAVTAAQQQVLPLACSSTLGTSSKYRLYSVMGPEHNWLVLCIIRILHINTGRAASSR